MLAKLQTKLSRRQWLATSFAVVAAGLGWNYLSKFFSSEKIWFPGRDFSPNRLRGHELKDGRLPGTPTKTESTDVLIVGAGISGLSAGWWLSKNRFSSFKIVEMEDRPGGNSRFGENETTKFPWGAHYLPIPNVETIYVKQLLEELGAITGYQGKTPIFDPLMVCSDPQERLLFRGKWQEGLIPKEALSSKEVAEIQRFLKKMDSLSQSLGKDGKPLFAIPLDLSSTDEQVRKLDQYLFSEWLDREGFIDPFLRWYIDYSCRDDFGASAQQISAWAGLHYFCARRGVGSELDPHSVLTWPEGNGWLVTQLANRLNSHLLFGQMVQSVKETDGGIQTTVVGSNHEVTSYHSKELIVCVPDHVRTHLLHEKRKSDVVSYPWLVANVALKERPHSKGAPPAWDNVSFNSKSLGYISATHQSTHPFPKKEVITFYKPLDTISADPKEARRRAMERNVAEWQSEIVDDLKTFHREIGDLILSIDVCVWGHGMVCPVPGAIWGKGRGERLRSQGRIHFAHTDLSGISIFEEAQYRGVVAAQAVLNSLRVGQGKA